MIPGGTLIHMDRRHGGCGAAGHGRVPETHREAHLNATRRRGGKDRGGTAQWQEQDASSGSSRGQAAWSCRVMEVRAPSSVR